MWETTKITKNIETELGQIIVLANNEQVVGSFISNISLKKLGILYNIHLSFLCVGITLAHAICLVDDIKGHDLACLDLGPLSLSGKVGQKCHHMPEKKYFILHLLQQCLLGVRRLFGHVCFSRNGSILQSQLKNMNN